MKELINYLGAGQLTTIGLIVLTVLFEITPIKFSPIKWFGSVIFSSTNKRLDRLEAKFDDHIVQAYRKTILQFQNECLRGQQHTMEEFKFVLKSCDAYEAFITENHILNGEVTIAMNYIRNIYQTTLQNGTFLPTN